MAIGINEKNFEVIIFIKIGEKNVTTLKQKNQNFLKFDQNSKK